MNRRLMTLFVLIAAVTTLVAYQVNAHCQVPCGIYDESARVQQMYEDATTIEKAMTEMAKLAEKDDPQSQQQFVRWVTNKEQHAERIMVTIGDYFLAQRVKPEFDEDGSPTAAYAKSLAEHHAVMLAAMKCKQSADPATVKTLREAIGVIEHRWVATHKH